MRGRQAAQRQQCKVVLPTGCEHLRTGQACNTYFEPTHCKSAASSEKLGQWASCFLNFDRNVMITGIQRVPTEGHLVCGYVAIDLSRGLVPKLPRHGDIARRQAQHRMSQRRMPQCFSTTREVPARTGKRKRPAPISRKRRRIEKPGCLMCRNGTDINNLPRPMQAVDLLKLSATRSEWSSNPSEYLYDDPEQD